LPRFTLVVILIIISQCFAFALEPDAERERIRREERARELLSDNPTTASAQPIVDAENGASIVDRLSAERETFTDEVEVKPEIEGEGVSQTVIAADGEMKMTVGSTRALTPWAEWGRDESRDAVELRRMIDEVVDNPRWEEAQWGILVKSLDTGKILYSRNSRKGFMPASNIKVFTTAAALGTLGPNHRYRTLLYSTDADHGDGVLNGNLYVLGSGDPSFSARYHNGDALAPLRKWVQALEEKGIRRITGDIVGDDRVFDKRSAADGWSWEYMSSWYAAEVGGLSLNDNCLDILLAPGAKAGEPIRAWTRGPSGYGEIINKAVTIGPKGVDSVEVTRRPGSNIIDVSGNLSLSAPRTMRFVTIQDSTVFFCDQLKRLLGEAGIVVEGTAREFEAKSDAMHNSASMTLVAEYQSPPLHLICDTINQTSMNLYAEMVLKTLGRHAKQDGGFEAGAAAVADFMRKLGVDTTGFEMVDGSGLSRLNLAQPYHMVALLEGLMGTPCFEAFEESLPVAGIDGTIANRMKTSAARGNLRAKSGFIRRVSALSGYADTLDGERLVFCLFLNNYTGDKKTASRAIDKICGQLAGFKRQGSVALK
jgi:D-alanyl-D-alanine carboxypeptidase/D-alanyl-D-alanine-endopeptidase (penicillin-binding protein 4)